MARNALICYHSRMTSLWVQAREKGDWERFANYCASGPFHLHISPRLTAARGFVQFTKGGEGLLIDWDLCINLRNEDAAAQFMSAKLLSDTRLKQGIEDDRESAFYVLLYLGLLYTKNNQIYQDL